MENFQTHFLCLIVDSTNQFLVQAAAEGFKNLDDNFFLHFQ